ncbi:MAG: Trp biosynthesis-associated membrane protein [Nocardioides sp.]|nr:Trp biosynthesis-associated membrane protein [Nocardioides sp.]
MPEQPGRPERSGLASTVLTGLASSGLAVLAASRDWARAKGDSVGVPVEAAVGGTVAAPLPWALALVVLASWGALLALRGRARTVVAALGTLAAAGAAVAVLVGTGAARDAAIDEAVQRGAVPETVTASLTPWPWVTLVVLVVALAAGLVGVRRAATWPSMSSRYDAPTAGGPVVTGAAADDAGARELWDALDEGHDPTV